VGRFLENIMTKKATKKVVNKAAPVESKPKVETIELVAMINESGKEANVHPLEVQNFELGGFKQV
jgi:hypothetical protein